MNIQIKATNIILTDDIRNHVYKKLSHVEKFLEKKDGLLVEVEVGKTTTHHRTGDVFRAEIMVSGSGLFGRAVSEKSDLYSAIDSAKDSLVQEIDTKHKKKISIARRTAGKVKDILRGITRWKK